MNSKLTSATIAAAIFASSSPLMAHGKGTTDEGTLTPCVHDAQDKKQTTKSKPAKKTDTKADKKTDTKADKKTDTKADKADKKSPKTKRRAEPVTEDADDDTSAAEDDTGKSGQGLSASEQQENERRAREKRERIARERQQSKAVGEDVGRATTTAATVIVDTAQDVARAMDQPAKYNTIAATWNPLGLIVGSRVSVNIEYAPITHHVIILSPHFANPSETASAGPDLKLTNRYTGVGGELGYRYYSGHNGMNGLFIGPSLIGGAYNASLSGREVPFSNFGLAADAGFQDVVWDHLAFGAGIGIEYLYVTKDFGSIGTGPSTIASAGLKPRFLAQAGYAF